MRALSDLQIEIPLVALAKAREEPSGNDAGVAVGNAFMASPR